MRRRNASSTRSLGSRLVEKIINCSNGTCIFLPVDSVRKSCRFSSGTIQRLSSSAGSIRCRPKSSINRQPQLLFSCSGASLTLARGSWRISRLSIVNSPPTTTVGRRILTQRRSKLAVRTMLSFPAFDHLVVGRVEQLDDLAVLDHRLRDPDVLAEAHRDALGQGRFAVARRAVQEQARARVDGRPQALEQVGIDRDVGEGLGQLRAFRGFGANRLGLDRQHVVGQRHRARVRCSRRPPGTTGLARGPAR